MITKADLSDQIGTDYPRDFLYCKACGAEISANVGDYSACPPRYVFNCCNMPMVLANKHTTIDIIKE